MMCLPLIGFGLVRPVVRPVVARPLTRQLVFLTLALLINDFLAPHLVLVMAMTTVLCLNLIPISEALAGFSNEGVLTIAVLFIVAKVRMRLLLGTTHLIPWNDRACARFWRLQAMEINGVMQVVTKYILRKPKALWDAQIRLILPVGVRVLCRTACQRVWGTDVVAHLCACRPAGTQIFSAFLNNTPIVAMMIPVVNDWAKRTKLPVSRLMLVSCHA